MLTPALKTAIDALSVQDKLTVFEVIRDSVMPLSESGFPELTPQQQTELLLRAARATEQPENGRSWAEVRARLAR